MANNGRKAEELLELLFICVHTESISTSEGPDANGLYTEKAMLSMILTRKEMSATFECRIESAALEATVRHQLKVDLQGKPRRISNYQWKLEISVQLLFG